MQAATQELQTPTRRFKLPTFIEKCDEGCTIYDQQIFTCDAPECTKECLCIGCSYECADCHEVFCSSHIKDLKEEQENTRYSEYLCVPCLTASRAKAKVAA